jgi:hypothetical protein
MNIVSGFATTSKNNPRRGFALFNEPEQHDGVEVSGAPGLWRATLGGESHGGNDGLSTRMAHTDELPPR